MEQEREPSNDALFFFSSSHQSTVLFINRPGLKKLRAAESSGIHHAISTVSNQYLGDDDPRDRTPSYGLE